MRLEQLRNIENLSVRAFNICKTSSLSTLDLILNWYKKYGNFKNIRNCGNNTNQELVAVCLKYKDLQELDTHHVVELDDDRKLVNLVSVRAYNICVNNGLNNVDSVVDFYKVNGSFDKLRTCGLKTNLELINFCKENIDSNSISKMSDDGGPVLLLIENFNRLQQRVIRYYYYLLLGNLPSQTRRALRDYLVDRSNSPMENVFEKILNNQAFDLGHFHFLGAIEIRKLSHFIGSFKNMVQSVSDISSREELVNFNYRLTLDSIFPNSELYYKLKVNTIFSVMKVAIENEVFFGGNILKIFINKFNIFDNNKVKLLNDDVNLSKERIRQICKGIHEDLFDKSRFINKLIDEPLDNNELFHDCDVVCIDQLLNEKINAVNQTDFSKEWNSYLIYVYFSHRFELIGLVEDVLFKKNNNKNGRHNWSSFYLVNNDLTEVFDFLLLVNDYKFALDSSGVNSIYFNINNYVIGKFGVSNSVDVLRISNIARFIIRHEFGHESDGNGNFLLQKNSRKPFHECVYVALETIGSQSSVSEITCMVAKLFPEELTTESKVRAALKRKFGFVPIGRSSVFGLIHWENEFSNFKGGTIRGLVSDYLKLEGSPRHIDSITDFVRKYRPNTYRRSVWDNLRADKAGIFVFSNDRFVGLKSGVSDDFAIRLPRQRSSITKDKERFESIIFDILRECPGQVSSKEFLKEELVKISQLNSPSLDNILNKASYLKRRLCIAGRPFYYYHTSSEILDISRDHDNIQDFILTNLKTADFRLEYYYKAMQKMIDNPDPEIITGAIGRLISRGKISQFYHKFIDNDSEILMSIRIKAILDNLIMGICESMANRRDISFTMDREVYNNKFVNDFVSYLTICGVIQINLYEINIEIVYLINYAGDRVLLNDKLEALFLPFVLKDYFLANKLECEFMVLGFNVKYNKRFNLISYE